MTGFRPGYDDVLLRLAELIAHGKDIVRSYSTDRGFTSSNIPEHELKSFVVSAASAVEQLAGRDSEFFRQLPSPMREGHFIHVAPAVPQGVQGVLTALANAIHNGHFEPRPATVAPVKQSALQLVEQLLARFHAVAIELRTRHGEREPLELDDEYDVQDLLRALLRISFDDVRPEEGAPSHAGGGSRMDFLLKAEQLVVEVKKTRKGLADKQVGEELVVDVARYRGHPDCKTLVCFVYDPEHRIRNPAGLQDLARSGADFTVRVVVAPSR